MHINIYLCVSAFASYFFFFRVYVFKHQQPPRLYPPSPVSVYAQPIGIPQSQQNHIDPLATRLSCLLIFARPIPPSELDIKQMNWGHIPSRWAFIWKQEALVQGSSARLPHSEAEEREWGKKWQDRFPMGCYSNDFCQSASFKAKVWGYISPPKECVKALYVANMFPAVS